MTWNQSYQSQRDLFSRENGTLRSCQFQRKFSCDRLYNRLKLSKLRDVKVVGHGSITSVAIDPLESRYILSGSSDGLIAIYDTQNATGTPKHVAEVVGITSNTSVRSRLGLGFRPNLHFPLKLAYFIKNHENRWFEPEANSDLGPAPRQWFNGIRQITAFSSQVEQMAN